MFIRAPGDARKPPTFSEHLHTVLTRLVRWASPLSIRHLPSWVLRTTTRVFLRQLPLLLFLTLFAVVYATIVLSLVRDFPAAFPHARTLWVSALVAVPAWGSVMCAWTARAPLLDYLRSRVRRRQYAALGDTQAYYTFDAAADAAEEEEDYEDGSSHYAQRKDLPAHREWTPALLAYLALALFGLYMLCTYALPGDHQFKEVVDLARREPRREGYGTGEKIFISAMFYNNAAVLPYWTTEIVKLIHYLGPANVFVSIIESYSTDASPALLRSFSRKLDALGVPQRILIQDTAIRRPESMVTAPPRIEYLAAVRNRVLEPLVGGYDRVLFSNDLFVEAESIVELLNTRDGDYDMACGLDFQHWGLYDVWVLRDRLGRIPSTIWPYFFDDSGFRAVMADAPAPVFTCWNGIVSMRAAPFLPPALRPTHGSSALSTSPLALVQPPYDLRRQFGLDKIYVNPRVITAYVWKYYLWFKYATRHWAVKWFIEKVENGSGMHLAKFVLGDAEEVWLWDGGECHPGPWYKEGEE
ncbi:cryptococcal mannosyltransferase 1-domain-containing protein [Mycena crocata]|nr:cryptococcal mannosyltransferase 1-domain-containing protein [Mycena crocata]